MTQQDCLNFCKVFKGEQVCPYEYDRTTYIGAIWLSECTALNFDCETETDFREHVCALLAKWMPYEADAAIECYNKM